MSRSARRGCPPAPARPGSGGWTARPASVPAPAGRAPPLRRTARTPPVRVGRMCDDSLGLLVEDLVRLAVDLLVFFLREVARLFLLSSSGLGVPRVRLVRHRVVARLLLRGLRPRLLRQSEI